MVGREPSRYFGIWPSRFLEWQSSGFWYHAFGWPTRVGPWALGVFQAVLGRLGQVLWHMPVPASHPYAVAGVAAKLFFEGYSKAYQKSESALQTTYFKHLLRAEFCMILGNWDYNFPDCGLVSLVRK